jgi:hypothetical protein
MADLSMSEAPKAITQSAQDIPSLILFDRKIGSRPRSIFPPTRGQPNPDTEKLSITFLLLPDIGLGPEFGLKNFKSKILKLKTESVFQIIQPFLQQSK